MTHKLRKNTLSWAVVGLGLLIATGGVGTWFFGGRTYSLSAAESSTMGSSRGAQADASEAEDPKRDQLLRRSRSIAPNASDEEYREMLLETDQRLREIRENEKQSREYQLRLVERRDLYAIRKKELTELIRIHGGGGQQTSQSIAADARQQLRLMEEDAPY